MKLLANVIIMSLMVTIAGLSKATNSLIDPTRPATFVDAVGGAASVEDGKQTTKVKDQIKSAAIPDYRLNAIKISRSSSMAIINGETVSQGQKIGSAKLVKINSNSVVMNVDGKVITVSLLPDSIKKVLSKDSQTNGKYDENK